MDMRRNYNIDRVVLGQGEFGTVYRASNKRNPKTKIAIKALDKRSLPPKEVEELYIEVEAMQKLDHENIVRLIETYDDDQFMYLCMEKCTGGDLTQQKFLTNRVLGKLDEPKVASVLLQLLKALSHIHSQNVIHRDIKPENIMFDRKVGGKVKLIDFGLACHADKNDNQQVGTPYFIAPEIIKENYGKECDIWSLGIVVYQMVTGTLPFKGNNKKELFKAIRWQDVYYPEYLSDNLIDLLSSMLVKNPKQRITAQEAINHPWFTETLSNDKMPNQFTTLTLTHNPLTSQFYQ